MSIVGVALYCLRAGIFAGMLCALYALYCLLRKKGCSLRRLLGVGYLAALVQITVLRGGVDWQRVFSGGRQARLLPFATIAELVRQGDMWNLCYNVIGNLIWFMPLGGLLCKRRGSVALSYGALLSACIELSQYLLRTGVSDVDDVILNAVGAYLGWAICHWRHKKGRWY